MPCRDGGCSEEENTSRRLVITQEKLDKVTRMLCGMITHLENTGFGDVHLGKADPELPVWWKAHQEEDRLRIAREKYERERKVQYAKDQIANSLRDFSPEEMAEILKDVKVK